MASTMSRMHQLAGRPPCPASHAGAGSSGSHTAHSASLMSEGYRRARALRESRPGQHRHATVPGTAAGWTSLTAAG